VNVISSPLAQVIDAHYVIDPTTLDEVTLGERALDVHTQIRRLQAVEAQLLHSLDVRDAAVADGFGSASMWLAGKDSTTTRGEAAAIVGLGRDLAVLPEMAAALAAGAVGAGHVRQVAKATKPLDRALAAEGDAFLAPLARTLDGRQFAMIVAVWLRSVRPDAADQGEERDWDSRSFTLAQTFGGMWHGIVNGEPDGGARLYALLEARATKTGPEDERTKDQRFYDALMSLADEAIANAGNDNPGGGGNVPEIIVHARPENLLGDPTAAPATRDDGTPLSRAGWECLSCDARWTRLLVDAVTQSIDLGRTTRDWSPALRKVIRARDGGCRYTNCPMPGTHIHHCTYWAHGGKTCADNGLLVCGWHHHCTHARGFGVKLLPDGTAVWTLPNGTTLESEPRGPTARLLL
jgi:hypothetical protein